jgi:hypothetical protein
MLMLAGWINRHQQAVIERFIRSIKEECLDRVIPLG